VLKLKINFKKLSFKKLSFKLNIKLYNKLSKEVKDLKNKIIYIFRFRFRDKINITRQVYIY